MKAVNNNGIITFYPNLPTKFRSSTGLHLNIQNWSEQDMKDHGLFDVIIDDNFDERIHDLGEIYWDTDNTVFRKDIINKTFIKSLEEYKEQAIHNFNSRIGSKLAQSDWYIIREMENGTEVPSEITSRRQTLRDIANSTEIELNELTSIEEIITFDYPNLD
tara:strand:- start:1134 stop:1616 length:483 start_codon:yes stop_codon:yes gene_type:complete